MNSQKFTDGRARGQVPTVKPETWWSRMWRPFWVLPWRSAWVRSDWVSCCRSSTGNSPSICHSYSKAARTAHEAS